MPRPKPSILIIEDSPPTFEMYRRELSRDYQVFACLSEQDALELLTSEPIRAVVLEPEIEGGRGWHWLTNIITALAGRRVPVILCSTQDEQRRGLSEGAAAFLVKPVLPVELREALWRILHERIA
jgi:DNA-binding response OmpR family regulator